MSGGTVFLLCFQIAKKTRYEDEQMISHMMELQAELGPGWLKKQFRIFKLQVTIVLMCFRNRKTVSYVLKI